MVISPFVLIISVAILIFTLIYCIKNRPNKPLFTGVCIIMLLIFLLFTYIINIGISNTSNVSNNQFILFMMSILFINQSTNINMAEDAFNAYAITDVCLISLCVISMVIEVKYLFSETAKIKKIKKEIKEIEETKDTTKDDVTTEIEL